MRPGFYKDISRSETFEWYCCYHSSEWEYSNDPSDETLSGMLEKRDGVYDFFEDLKIKPQFLLPMEFLAARN